MSAVLLTAEHVDGVLRLTKVGDTSVAEMTHDDLVAMWELISAGEIDVMFEVDR